MAIWMEEKKTNSRSGEYSLSLNNRSWKKNSSEDVDFVVCADRPTDSLEKIVSTPGLPVLGGVYNGRVCRKLAAQRENLHAEAALDGDATYTWIVTAEFDSDFQSDPLELPAEVSDDVEIIEETAWYDRDGKPIVNANGEIYQETRPVCVTTRNIRRYEPSAFNVDVINAQYANTISSGNFWGWPKWCAYMLPVTGNFVQVALNEKEKVWLYLANYKIRFKPPVPYEDPWTRRLLHQGNMYRPTPGADPRRCTELKGQPTQVNLDEDGCLLAEDAPPVYLKFKLEPEKDFRELEIDRDQLNWDGKVYGT